MRRMPEELEPRRNNDRRNGGEERDERSRGSGRGDQRWDGVNVRPTEEIRIMSGGATRKLLPARLIGSCSACFPFEFWLVCVCDVCSLFRSRPTSCWNQHLACSGAAPALLFRAPPVDVWSREGTAEPLTVPAHVLPWTHHRPT